MGKQSREWHLNFKFPLLKVLVSNIQRRFKRYHLASGLNKKSSQMQVSALIYNMENQADNIVLSFRLSDKKPKAKVIS